MLPQEQSAAQWKILLNTYWDHTIACMFEKACNSSIMMYDAHQSSNNLCREHILQDIFGIEIWKPWWMKGGVVVKIGLIWTFLSAVAGFFFDVFPVSIGMSKTLWKEQSLSPHRPFLPPQVS